jgi:hypothetical protein
VAKFLVCTTHEIFWNVVRKKSFAKNCAVSNGNFTTTSSGKISTTRCVMAQTCAVLSKTFLARHISKFSFTQVKVNWAPIENLYYWILRLEDTTECNGEIKSCSYTKPKFLLLQTGQYFVFCRSQVTWWRQPHRTARMAYVTLRFVMPCRQRNYVLVLLHFGTNRLIISTNIKISDIQ